MIRAWRFAIATACCEGFQGNMFFSLTLGHCFHVGQGTTHLRTSLTIIKAEMVAALYALRVVKMTLE